MALTSADARLLSDTILGLREIGVAEEFATVALRAVAGLVRSDVWTWNEVDPRVGVPMVRYEPQRVEDAARLARLQRFGELVHEHPLISHVSATGDGSARMLSDHLTTAQLHATTLYREVYAAEGVEHQVAITMPAPLPRVVGLAGSRGTLGDDFDERDRLLLDLVRPHLAQAYELHRERVRLHGVARAAVAALRGSGTHAVVLGTPPYELTPGAMALLYSAFGGPAGGTGLPRRVADWAARTRAAEPDPTDVRRPLVARRDGHEVVARLVPDGAPDGGDVLLLRETEADGVAALGNSLGLTAREAEVLALVAQGLRNADVAARLHLAPSTVKTHLEQVYRKLGVSNRTAAVALARDLLVSGP